MASEDGRFNCCICDEGVIHVHDGDCPIGPFGGCATLEAMGWRPASARVYVGEKHVVTRLAWVCPACAESSARCQATKTAIDGSCPTVERCQREVGHEPPHHCPHGFHWTDDPRVPFKGVCGLCKVEVELRPEDGSEVRASKRVRRARRA
jgi:hypothetical protein